MSLLQAVIVTIFLFPKYFTGTKLRHTYDKENSDEIHLSSNLMKYVTKHL